MSCRPGYIRSLELWVSLIKKTQRSSWLSLRPCNTSEMTLGRVLGSIWAFFLTMRTMVEKIAKASKVPH
jgi:hypothetical protein